MTPEISEFSYGFALTNEIVGWTPLTAAPIFPSLIEEGRRGGGYDVHLNMPGIPLYLQFKRSDCMKLRSALEIRKHKLSLTLPFYRFKVTERTKSDQHDLLLALDNGSNAVFYAAPVFHRLDEIDDAWNNNDVANRSIFVRPSSIGPLGYDSHHVAFDGRNAFLCSEPRPLEFVTSGQLVQGLVRSLIADARPLEERIPEFLDQLRLAVEQAESQSGYEPVPLERGTATEPGVPVREPRPLEGAAMGLRTLADIAARNFNAQLILIQPK